MQCANILLKPAPVYPKVNNEHLGGIPEFISSAYWNSASGQAILCSWQNGQGELVVTATNLVPQGVYTAWFITDRGAMPAAPLRAEYTADGYDPNRLVVNMNGTLNYYIAHLDYDPFKGIPYDGGVARINSVVLAYHPDGQTHGRRVGPHYEHLMGLVIKPIGV
ncbi:MAG: hypothetical protein ACYDG6_09485 [Thermincolia bacterium]